MKKASKQNERAAIPGMRATHSDAKYIGPSLIHARLRHCTCQQTNRVMRDCVYWALPDKPVFNSYNREEHSRDAVTDFRREYKIINIDSEPQDPNCAKVDGKPSTHTLRHIFDFRRRLMGYGLLLSNSGKATRTAPMAWKRHKRTLNYWKFTKLIVISVLKEQGLKVLPHSPRDGAWSLLVKPLNSRLVITECTTKTLPSIFSHTSPSIGWQYLGQEKDFGLICGAKKPSASG